MFAKKSITTIFNKNQSFTKLNSRLEVSCGDIKYPRCFFLVYGSERVVSNLLFSFDTVLAVLLSVVLFHGALAGPLFSQICLFQLHLASDKKIKTENKVNQSAIDSFMSSSMDTVHNHVCPL